MLALASGSSSSKRTRLCWALVSKFTDQSCLPVIVASIVASSDCFRGCIGTGLPVGGGTGVIGLGVVGAIVAGVAGVTKPSSGIGLVGKMVGAVDCAECIVFVGASGFIRDPRDGCVLEAAMRVPAGGGAGGGPPCERPPGPKTRRQCWMLSVGG